mmetsp:Transcript_18749/g.38671  ORF Transcript_18749/g.38671 Transcript_18749/m.38671 type:complete len:609 (+) Transcript_18749:1187-3013(+)
MESVLRHVSHAQARGLPDRALCRLRLTDEDLDSRGLAGAISTDDSHTADLRDREAHIYDGGLVLCGVGEGDVVHAEDDLAAALHALHGTRLGEDKLHGLVGKLEVSFLLRVLLDKHGEGLALITLEGLELPILEVDDVRAHLVEEGREVGGADNAAWEFLEPVFKPLDVVHIQVASGLVQHEHIGIHKLRGTKLHLHLPATGIASHRVLEVGRTVRAARVAEADGLHEFLHLLLVNLVLHLVRLVAGVHDPPPAGLVHAENREAVILHTDLLILNLVLDEDALQLVALGETFELLIGDGTHERGLAALVRAQEAVEAIPLQVHLCVPEQRQRAVSQGEGALVQIYAIGVLLLYLLLGLRCNLHLCPDILNHAVEGGKEANTGLPSIGIEAAHVRRHRRQGSDVGGHNVVGLVAARLVPEGLLQNSRRLRRGDVLDISALARLLESLQRLLCHGTGLGVGDLLSGRLHKGLQAGHHGDDRGRVLDDLAHVVHNLAASALDFLRLVVEPPGEHGQHGSKCGRLHILHEDAPRKLLHALVCVVEGLGGLDHGGEEGLQVPVASAGTDSTHALHCRSLDLFLEVAGQVGNGRHQGHKREADGPRGRRRDRRN